MAAKRKAKKHEGDESEQIALGDREVEEAQNAISQAMKILDAVRHQITHIPHVSIRAGAPILVFEETPSWPIHVEGACVKWGGRCAWKQIVEALEGRAAL
jgi:dihydroorotase-like cyclic amidohydrolase